MQLLGSLLFFFLLFFNLLIKLREKRSRYRLEGTIFPVEPTSSLLSQAIVELLATAGGIYLALVMGTAFLQIDVVQKLIWGELKIDFLAFFSIVLALLQPFILKIFLLVSR